MRRACSTEPAWIADNDQLIGIQLGADFCAEHEWGIKELKKSFGIISSEDANKGKIFGVHRHVIQQVNPDHLLFRETKTIHEAILIYKPRFFGSHYGKSHKEEMTAKPMEKLAENYEIGIYKPWKDEEPETLACAWDQGSFGIHVKDCKQQYDWLAELYQSLLAKDIVVFLGQPPMPAFSNSSLNLIIASRIPQKGLDIMEQTDREQWELKRDANKTGIAKKLEKAGLKYFALSPRRGTFENTPPTDYDLLFWLNPMQQDRNNSGWFTVEELEQWIEGKGPVPKKETV